MLLADLARHDLGANERKALNTFHEAVEGYPNAMPHDNTWYWLRLECGNNAFTVYLYPDRFKLYADAGLPEKVEWEVRFWGGGRRDRRDGDAAAALERMRQASLAPDFTLKVSAK